MLSKHLSKTTQVTASGCIWRETSVRTTERVQVVNVQIRTFSVKLTCVHLTQCPDWCCPSFSKYSAAISHQINDNTLTRLILQSTRSAIWQ